MEKSCRLPFFVTSHKVLSCGFAAITKLKKEGNELNRATNQLNLTAPDGKRQLTDVPDNEGVLALAKCFPNNKAMQFMEWFTNSDETIDGKSKSKAYALFPIHFTGVGNFSLPEWETLVGNPLKLTHHFAVNVKQNLAPLVKLR